MSGPCRVCYNISMKMVPTGQSCRLRLQGAIVALCVLSLIVLLLQPAGAVQVGRTVIFRGGSMGKVVFDGRVHNEAGYHCMKCHNQYFIPRIGAAAIAYADHTARRQYCFGCHDGGRAFDALRSCNRCHTR